MHRWGYQGFRTVHGRHFPRPPPGPRSGRRRSSRAPWEPAKAQRPKQAGHHLAGVDGSLQVPRADHGRRDEVTVHLLAVAPPGLDELHHRRVQPIRGFPCNRGWPGFPRKPGLPPGGRGQTATPFLPYWLLGHWGIFQLLGSVCKAAPDSVWEQTACLWGWGAPPVS